MRALRPRIALNAQLLRLNAGYRSAGIAQYILHLLRALPAAAPDLELHAYTGEPRTREMLSALQIHLTRWRTESPTARIIWEQVVFPFELAHQRSNLIHALAYASPLLSGVPAVVTVYDLSFILYPEYFRATNRTYLRWVTRWSTGCARHVIAISESTKQDLIRLFSLPANRVEVIPLGVEPEFFEEGKDQVREQFRRAKNLPEHFVLFIGTQEPRKNIPTLIRAFAQAKSRAHLPHRLVIAGGRGWMDDSIERTIEELNLQREVLRPGFIAQEELPLWYRAADVFVYPSQYEGFGLPPLEAMAAGTPVITSNCSSLPEVVGDAALLIDPRDEASLAEALSRVLTDSALSEDLGRRGRARAREFTWARAAQATAQAYRRVLNLGSEG